MSSSTLDIKDLGFVLRGKFNPIIFHPQWLLRKELISAGIAETVNLRISHPEISEFELEFCNIQVTLDTFSISTSQELHFRTTRDLLVNIFECLPESHVIQLGINFHHHYKFNNKEEYVNFGHRIVPKDNLWKSVLKTPSLANILIQGERTDDNNGKKSIMVRPSIKAKSNINMVEIQVNDHFDLYKKEESEEIDASRALELIKTRYDKSIEESSAMIKEVYEYGISVS